MSSRCMVPAARANATWARRADRLISVDAGNGIWAEAAVSRTRRDVHWVRALEALLFWVRGD